MKKTIKISKFFTTVCFLGLAVSAYAELGQNFIDTNPSDKPIYANKGNFANTRSWNCAGHVNPEFQKTLLNDLSILSKNNNLQKPDNYCIYSIKEIKQQNETVYEVGFYLSQASLDKCLKNDICDETRSVSFPTIRGELYRQYFLDSLSKGVIADACLTGKGDVVSMNKRCR
jgi:hypothetical protein